MICSKAMHSIPQAGKLVSFVTGIKLLSFSYFEFLFQLLMSLKQSCYFVTLKGGNLFKCSKRVGQTNLESQLRKQLKCPVSGNQVMQCKWSMVFFCWSIITLQYFISFCCYNKVLQLYIYIYPLPVEPPCPQPIPQVITEH